jgi:D-lactate dehydrogenase (cytochrome)
MLSQSYLKSAILGHVGDGNFHALIIIDPNRPEDMQEAERLNHCIVQDASQCRWNLHGRARGRDA